MANRQTSSLDDLRRRQIAELCDNVRGGQHIDVTRDLVTILELHDVGDELKIIEKQNKEQEACVSEMIKQYRRFDNQRMGLNGVAPLEDVATFLAKQRKKIYQL